MPQAPRATNTVSTMQPVNGHEMKLIENYENRWSDWIERIEKCFDREGECSKAALSSVLDDLQSDCKGY